MSARTRHNDSSNKTRTSLRSLLNHQVVYTGTLFEVRVNRWRAHYANVLLKPVTIAGKDYDHIWIKISLKRLLKWMPYLIEVVDTDARYYTYKAVKAISTQHPRVISHIMQIASPRNESLSMYDLEHMNDEPEDLDVQINACTISGNAKVVQYYRNPKNKLIQHDVNDGFTFDYGILANSADLDVDTTPLVTDKEIEQYEEQQNQQEQFEQSELNDEKNIQNSMNIQNAQSMQKISNVQENQDNSQNTNGNTN